MCEVVNITRYVGSLKSLFFYTPSNGHIRTKCVNISELYKRCIKADIGICMFIDLFISCILNTSRIVQSSTRYYSNVIHMLLTKYK